MKSQPLFGPILLECPQRIPPLRVTRRTSKCAGQMGDECDTLPAPLLPRFSLKNLQDPTIRDSSSTAESRTVSGERCRATPAFSLFKTGAFNHSATPPWGKF
jgi:hypothetical protein